MLEITQYAVYHARVSTGFERKFNTHSVPVSDGMLTLKEIYIHTLYLPVMVLAYHHRQAHLCVLKGMSMYTTCLPVTIC